MSNIEESLGKKYILLAQVREQLSLFETEDEPSPLSNASTFSDNLSLPIHRWFRFSAGFSATWVKHLIKVQKAKGYETVLDPFAGSGTVVLEGEQSDVEAVGIEAHPFLLRVAQTKLHWRQSASEFTEFALEVLRKAESIDVRPSDYPPLIEKCFPISTISRLDSIRIALEMSQGGSACSDLTWLALISILRECSPVGTAQWQYILPAKRKAKYTDPYDAFLSKIEIMSRDMAVRQLHNHGPKGQLVSGDARDCSSIEDKWADLVITSPPYANNYDYADATRLEMTFLGEVSGWKDLQDTVRQYLIRSCSQHVSASKVNPAPLLSDPALKPILDELIPAFEKLDSMRANRGGKKQYHAMIVAYFLDMARVWKALRRVTHDRSLLCFVIGDSAPYGIHIPVERWNGQLALAAGFRSYRFEKLRDRNIKWKNRKHRVPLQEGLLWVEG